MTRWGLALALLAACGRRSSSPPIAHDAASAPASAPAARADAAPARRWPGPCSSIKHVDGKPDDTVLFRYDGAGRVAGWSSDGTEHDPVLGTRAYDPAGRLVEVRRIDKVSADIWAGEYDDRGHATSVTEQLIIPDVPFQSGLGADVDLQVEKLRARSTPPRQRWSAAYDARGHLAVEHPGYGAIVRFTTDDAGRVLTRDYDDGTGSGSRITYTYVVGAACRPSPRATRGVGGADAFEPADLDDCPETKQRTSRDGASLQEDDQMQYSAAGDLLRVERLIYEQDRRSDEVYSYDDAGNLLAERWLGNKGVVEQTATFTYDCWR